jgi:hypothetical protein
MAILNPTQIVEQLTVLKHHADTYGRLVHARAVREYALAFGHEPKRGDGLDACVVHNSLVGRWAEVDRSHMRKCKWLLDDRQFLANRLVDAWYTRKYREWQAAGCP